MPYVGNGYYLKLWFIKFCYNDMPKISFTIFLNEDHLQTPDHMTFNSYPRWLHFITEKYFERFKIFVKIVPIPIVQSCRKIGETWFERNYQILVKLICINWPRLKVISTQISTNCTKHEISWTWKKTVKNNAAWFLAILIFNTQGGLYLSNIASHRYSNLGQIQ